MPFDNPKALAAEIGAKISKAKAPTTKAAAVNDEGDVFAVAAGDAFDAVKEGSRDGFAAALKEAVRACMAKGESKGEDAEDAEDY